jgi:hypothetical protein
MVQRTKIFQVLILKQFIACFEVFPKERARWFLRRKIGVVQTPQDCALTDA